MQQYLQHVNHHREGLLWAASDDGMIHVSKDAGENWKM